LPSLDKAKQLSQSSFSVPDHIIKWVKRWQSIGFGPLIGLKKGQWARVSSCFRVQDASDAIFREIRKQSKKSRKDGRKIRVVISHKDNIEQAKALKSRLKEIGAEVSFTNSVASVFDQAIIRGSLIASWDTIDGNY
jgi:hypothetical protein